MNAYRHLKLHILSRAEIKIHKSSVKFSFIEDIYMYIQQCLPTRFIKKKKKIKIFLQEKQ